MSGIRHSILGTNTGTLPGKEFNRTDYEVQLVSSSWWHELLQLPSYHCSTVFFEVQHIARGVIAITIRLFYKSLRVGRRLFFLLLLRDYNANDS